MRASSGWRWHLDEMFVKINGEHHYLWRAVDHEGEVLEAFVSKKRDREAALKFLRKLMQRHSGTVLLPLAYGPLALELGHWDGGSQRRCKWPLCGLRFAASYASTGELPQSESLSLFSYN